VAASYFNQYCCKRRLQGRAV